MLEGEPYDRNRARKRVSEILASGYTEIWQHCLDEAKNDGLTAVDVEAVLNRGLITEPAEWRGDHWRYRLHLRNLCVVVQFEDEQTVAAVTVFDKSRKQRR